MGLDDVPLLGTQAAVPSTQAGQPRVSVCPVLSTSGLAKLLSEAPVRHHMMRAFNTREHPTYQQRARTHLYAVDQDADYATSACVGKYTAIPPARMATHSIE